MRKKILILSGSIALIDQLVKLFVTNVMSSDSIVVIKNFLSLTYVKNDGAAWGIFSGNRWFLIAVSIISIYAIIKYFLLDSHITKIEFVGYSLVLGGLIGNLIDRVLYGYVTDFIDFRFGSYDFPVFNIADASMVIGVFIILYCLLRSASIQRRKK